MLLRYFHVAMDAKPKAPGLKPVDAPVAGNTLAKPGSETHATKYPGSFGNPDCMSKNPKGCVKHKTGEFASPGSPYAARGVATATAVKAQAAKATRQEKPKNSIKTLEQADAHVKNLIASEKDPKKKAAMEAQWAKEYARLQIKGALAKVQAKKTVEAALTAAGSSQTESKTMPVLPEEGDYDGWKAHYKKLFDGKKAKLDQQYAAGQLDDDAYTDALESAKDKYESRCAKIDKKINAESEAKTIEENAKKNEAAASLAEQPKAVPPPPTMPEDDDEDGNKAWHQGLHDEAMQALKDEWNKGGMSTEAYGKKYNAIKKKLKDGMSEVQAKFHPELNKVDDLEQDAPESEKVTMTGVASEDQHKEVSERVGVLNDAMKKAGLNTKIHAVHATPFATSFVFHNEGKPSPKQINMLESKLGDGVEIVQVKGKPDTWAVKANNKQIANVSFKKMMEDENLNKSTEGMMLPLALGLNEKGHYHAIDMSKMPHMLIAGTTGMGKSSVLNSALTSLFTLRGPDDVEVYCVDAKGTELGAYKNMPQVRKMVIGPDVKATTDLLDDCIKEMEDRNEFFQHLGVKDLKGYNLYRKQHPEKNLPKIKPRLVAIDELAKFADNPDSLSAVSGRLYQLGALARSAGIHVIATVQSPTEKTVGSIKKNFPARIAVKNNDHYMANNIGIPESENLTGKGDMYLKTDDGLVRIKSAFIDDKLEGKTKSDLDTTLEEIANKWGGPKSPEETKPSIEGGSAAGGEQSGTATPSTGSTDAPSTATETKPEPKPYTAGKTTSEHTYPNSKDPVDISHLGFFKAVVEAIKQGAHGNAVTWNHDAYQKMGAEKWAKHLAEQKGEAPDYSQHHLATIHPLPETATAHQKEMYKKWCGKVNSEWNKGDNADPARIHAIELQYLKWLKDEGLDAKTNATSKQHVNKYLNQES